MTTDAHSPPQPPDAGTGERRRPDPPPDATVIVIGMAAVLGVVAWAAFGKDNFSSVTDHSLNWVLGNFSWLFIIAGNVFLVTCLVIAFSRFGRIRLGRDDDEPEFSSLSWIAMMFAAGMGIGLMFFGVGEPLLHFADPPPFGDIEPGSPEAARAALEYSFFHWTLHPWAIYGVAALGLAYATFRKGRGNQISAVFVPLIGSRLSAGWPGRLIDLLAVFATVFGTATSLGLGALQVSKGLNITTDIDDTLTLRMIIIGALGAAFVISASSGLHKGVKWLSNINIVLAISLALFIFVVGPTVYILGVVPAGVGVYLEELLVLSSRTGAFGNEEWLGTWTIFYWAWWMSWAPFVGTFIARISRGRTIREFLIGVLLIPSGASVLWFSILGGSALRIDSTGGADLTGEVNNNGEESALFALLDALPLGTLTAFVAMILVMLYFITSADSASLVMGSLTSRGALHPRKWLVVAWGVLMGAVAAALLVAGGLDALRSGTILVALPFVVVMLAMCWALVTELRTDPGAGAPRHMPLHGLREAVRTMVGEAVEERARGPRHWRLRRTAGNVLDRQDGTGRPPENPPQDQ
ncbi:MULTISPECIES: BCCT family transporter [unclassified Streptomyces]|uniref:BCCT family transporter n=1 Tax=unclassified Streptomyces TaxID=2593676 RepID=UPI001908306F|nr:MULTISPECIES: BCCT family transporter [unclassified Streptomyces]MCU4746408.1 BCCT family transporter [Streptomyces sp. G-5]QQN76691.1 BCCT family transporter [Streptomyces sp. XC 2026]